MLFNPVASIKCSKKGWKKFQQIWGEFPSIFELLTYDSYDFWIFATQTGKMELLMKNVKDGASLHRAIIISRVSLDIPSHYFSVTPGPSLWKPKIELSGWNHFTGKHCITLKMVSKSLKCAGKRQAAPKVKKNLGPVIKICRLVSWNHWRHM